MGAHAKYHRWSLVVGMFAVTVALVTAPLAAMAAEAKPAQRTAKAHKSTRTVAAKTTVRRVAAPVVPARPSFGETYGLHATDDPLDLKSSVALVIDQDTDQVLFSKNPGAVLPIASITKLMTAVVVTDAYLPMDEMLTISQDDVDTE